MNKLFLIALSVFVTNSFAADSAENFINELQELVTKNDFNSVYKKLTSGYSNKIKIAEDEKLNLLKLNEDVFTKEEEKLNATKEFAIKRLNAHGKKFAWTEIALIFAPIATKFMYKRTHKVFFDFLTHYFTGCLIGLLGYHLKLLLDKGNNCSNGMLDSICIKYLIQNYELKESNINKENQL